MAPFGNGAVGDILANAKHLAFTDEEIANRVNTGYEPDRIPTERYPAFRQIEPSVSGRDLNDPSMDARSGNLKFSDESV